MRILLIAVAAAMIGGVATYLFLTPSPEKDPHRVYRGIVAPGMVISTIDFSVAAGAGFILPNDRVDVLLTRTGDNKPEIILKNIRVLAIDQNTADRNAQKPGARLTATLEVMPAQADILKQSGAQGALSLSLRSITDTSQ